MPTAVEGSRDSGWLSFFSPNALPGVFPTPNCLFLPGNQIICSFAGCPLPRSPRLYPITTAGLFVSAFPCSRMPLCSPSGGGKAAFKTVRSAGRAEHRRALARSAVAGKVPRALNTGCCHLFRQAEEVLGKSHQPPKNRPGSCSRSRWPCCLLQDGEMHLGKLLPAAFLTILTKKLSATGHGVLFALEFSLIGHRWHFCHTSVAT